MGSIRPYKTVAIVSSGELVPLLVAVENYVSDYQFSPKTERAKALDLEAFADFVSRRLQVKAAHIQLCDLSRPDFEAFREFRLREESTSTVRRRMDTLKHFSRWVSAKYRTADIAFGVKSPSIEDSFKFNGLSDFEYKRVISVLPEFEPLKRFTVELVLSTGLRCNEASTLTLGQISDDWLWYTKVFGKGRKYRDIPITPQHRRELMRYMTWRHQFPTRPEYPLLFSSRASRQRDHASYRVSDKTIWRYTNEIYARAGVAEEKRHPHTGRHTYADRSLTAFSLVYGQATAFKLVQQALGHTDIRTTLRYTTKDRDTMQEAFARFV